MPKTRGGLVVVETHPIQYRVPVYRELEQLVDAPVTMIFGSDFSVSGYYDKEFRSSFAWDADLLPEGSDYRFLSRLKEGGAKNYDEVRADGLGELLDELKPRAVLLTGYTNPLDRGAIARALTRRIPVLFRAETTDIAIERGALKAAVRRAVLRRLYARFRGLLAIGKNSYQHYLDCGVAKEKLWLAPYCVSTAPFACGEEDRERLRGAVRRELETPDDAAVFLFSGKLSKRKGPAVLLEAVRRLQDEVRRKCAVWFLGDGAERQALEEQGRGMACRFLGFRNQTELSRYYHGADVMSLPSVLSETWGLVVNEALHHGLPAVVSDGVGSAADLIERGVTGDVAAAGSVEELAGALERTLTLAGRADIREACRRKMEGYTVRRAAEGIAQAFTSLNGGGRG